METMKLSNGVMIPNIGYGTWQSPDSEITVEGIKTAVSAGYRHIDTAAVECKLEDYIECLDKRHSFLRYFELVGFCGIIVASY